MAQPSDIPLRGRATFAGGIYDGRRSPRERAALERLLARGYPIAARAIRERSSREILTNYMRRRSDCGGYAACLEAAADAAWPNFACPPGCPGASQRCRPAPDLGRQPGTEPAESMTITLPDELDDYG